MRITFDRTHRRGYAVDIARERYVDLTMNPERGRSDPAEPGRNDRSEPRSELARER